MVIQERHGIIYAIFNIVIFNIKYDPYPAVIISINNDNNNGQSKCIFCFCCGGELRVVRSLWTTATSAPEPPDTSSLLPLLPPQGGGRGGEAACGLRL